MTMKITLLVFTDGRTTLWDTLRSFESSVHSSTAVEKVVVNDNPDPRYEDILRSRLEDYRVVNTALNGKRSGFCDVIRKGWRSVSEDTTHVFHLEDDFTFNTNIDIDAMLATLEEYPELVQIALKRQPWNEREKEVGDLIALSPDEYLQVDGIFGSFLKHRLFWTTNPSLYRRSLLERGWPSGPECEGKFGLSIKQDPNLFFAYWGKKHDPPMVTHIGTSRTGTGY